MNATDREIEVGDRFETKDKRDEGRVIEVTERIPTWSVVVGSRRERAANLSVSWRWTLDRALEWLRQSETRYWVRTEAHPKNPSAVNHVSQVHERTLRTRYKRISR